MSTTGANFYHAIQVWKPAVKVETENGASFLVNDEDVYNLRIKAFAIAVIAATCWVSMAISTIVVSPPISILVALVVMRFAALHFRKQQETAIDNFAIEVFKNKTTLPKVILEHLASSPAAVARLLQQETIDLKNEKWNTLLERVSATDYRQEYPVFKLLIKALIETNQYNTDLFLKLLNLTKHIETTHFLLKKSPGIASKLTQEQQLVCLKQFRNDLNLGTAVKAGFNINTKVSEQTLLSWICSFDPIKINLLSLVLKWGADAVMPKTSFSFSQYKIRRLFYEIRKLRENNKEPTVDKPLRPVPTWQLSRAAIKDSLAYKDGVSKRIKLIAIHILLPLSAIFVYHGFPIALTFTAISFAAYAFYEKFRTTKALNDLAIQNFKTDFFHTDLTSKYVMDHPEVIDQLIKEKVDLSKLDKNGDTLLDLILDLPETSNTKYSLFTKVIDQLLLQNLSETQKYFYFLSILQVEDVRFLSYAIEKGLVQDVRNCSFDGANIVELFLNISNLDYIKMLVDQGFDINAKTLSGSTTLALLRKLPIFDDDFGRSFRNKMLENGAKTGSSPATFF